MMSLAALLLSVFRMVVLPVEFSDRAFTATQEQLAADVREAEAYFNRQFDGQVTFEFVLAPVTVLSHGIAYYGQNYPDRKDVRLREAFLEACTARQGDVDFARFDNDGDGTVDNVFLLAAGPGEDDGGGESAFWPRQGRLSAEGGVIEPGGWRIDGFAVSTEGRTGIFCHEFGHVLGLADLYDTDGEESGGRSRGMWGTSLMDEGCQTHPLPDFGALEFDLLGLGRCDTLRTGPYRLDPLATGRRYLKAPTDTPDEFFLFECREGMLLISHIDRSENPAGYSPRFDQDLTARERWDLGAVNDNPEHPCARLVPADTAATDLRGIPWPGDGADSFGSDTPSAFRGWSGHGTGLALTGIRTEADGSVSFDVIEPIVLTDLILYQDAAVLSWKPDPSLQGIAGYTVRWTDGEQTFLRQLGPEAGTYTLEHLRPQTGYSATVQVRLSERERYSATVRFVTKVYRAGTFPYIYLNSVRRNIDGTFPPGSRLPLRVFNATEVEEVQWFFDGTRIRPEMDGGYTLRRSGLLSARILHTDGTSETLYKEIRVQ